MSGSETSTPVLKSLENLPKQSLQDKQSKLRESEVIASLRELLVNGDELDRCNAIRSLVSLQAREAIPEIIDFLQDEDIDVCIDAAEALGNFKAKEAIEALLKVLLNDPEGEVKTAATKSLGKIGGEKVEQALIKLAKDRPEDIDWNNSDDWDDWWNIQKEAVIALGELRSKEAIPVLIAMVRDEDSQDIQIDILRALAKIGGKADKKLKKLLDLENFSSKLSHADKSLRHRIITAMATSNSNKTLKALGLALTDKYADIRATAITSLTDRKAETYLIPIMLMLRDPEPEVKVAALKAIKQLSQESDNDEALEAEQLVQLLKQNNDSLQLTTINTILSLTKQNRFVDSIEQLSESGQALLRACLTNKQISVVGTAAQILGKIKDNQSLHFLMQLFNKPNSLPFVRQEVIRSIACFYETEEQARNLVNSALFDKEQSVRLAVADGLLNASNRMEEVNETILPPMEVLLATINGEKIYLGTSSEAQEIKISEKEIQAYNSDKEQLSEKKSKENKALVPEPDEEPGHESMSTLDSIAMDNVESALASRADFNRSDNINNKNRPQSPATLIAPENEELAPYVEVIKQNNLVAQKIVRQKINIDDDVRRVCIRLVAHNQQPQYHHDILETFCLALNDEDISLHCEAVKAIVTYNINHPKLGAIKNNFSNLTTLLDSDDEEMRLACINALAHSCNRAALPHLIKQLQNSNYLVVLRSLEAISRIIIEHPTLLISKQDYVLNNNELDDEALTTEIKPLLTHSQYSVRMAAAETLASLNIEDLLPVYIEVGLSGQAQLAEKVAGLLKEYAPDKASQLILKKIADADNSALRGHLMDMLVTINRKLSKE